MNPEINKLQILNDLIMQALDVINQRGSMLGGLSHGGLSHGGLSHGGLSHSPYVADPRWNVDPRVTTPIGSGFSHTPYGFSHQGWNVDPRFAYSVDPRFTTPAQSNWGAPVGLSHSSYIDPRFGYGFQSGLIGYGVPGHTGYGVPGHTGYGVPYRW